jgi:hypothetical protein
MRIRIWVRMWAHCLENEEEDSQYCHEEGAICKRGIQNEGDEDGMKVKASVQPQRACPCCPRPEHLPDGARRVSAPSACACLRQHHVDVGFTAARTSPARDEGAEADFRIRIHSDLQNRPSNNSVPDFSLEEDQGDSMETRESEKKNC